MFKMIPHTILIYLLTHGPATMKTMYHDLRHIEKYDILENVVDLHVNNQIRFDGKFARLN